MTTDDSAARIGVPVGVELCRKMLGLIGFGRTGCALDFTIERGLAAAFSPQ